MALRNFHRDDDVIHVTPVINGFTLHFFIELIKKETRY
jgi:hypothetical protein